MKRKPVNKAKSAKEFRRNVSHTKAANVRSSSQPQNVMRGGWRL